MNATDLKMNQRDIRTFFDTTRQAGTKRARPAVEKPYRPVAGCQCSYPMVVLDIIRSYLSSDDSVTHAAMDVLTRFSPGQQHIIDAVYASSTHLLVLGAGGSGKSFVIRALRGLLPTVRVCAFTGLAANNVGGRTIDSLLCDPDMSLESLDTLIVDEISLCSAQKLHQLVSSGVRRLLMFGDFQQLPPVVTAADNPALGSRTYAQEREQVLEDGRGYHPDTGALFAFEADLFKDPDVQVFLLTSQFRQSPSESRLRHVLECLRNGTAMYDLEVRQFLLDRERAYLALSTTDRYAIVHLFTDNRRVNAHNDRMFRLLEGQPECTYTHSYRWCLQLDRYGYSSDPHIRAAFQRTTRHLLSFLATVPEYRDMLRQVTGIAVSVSARTKVTIPWEQRACVATLVRQYRHLLDDDAILCLTSVRPQVVLEAPSDVLGPIPATLLNPPKVFQPCVTLRVGQRIMCTMNARQHQVFNGLLGTIVQLHATEVQIRTDGNDIRIVRMMDRYEYKQVQGRPLFFRYHHMPLVGAGAMTIHKAQGQTLPRAVLFLGTDKPAPPGAVYTAISRCVTEAGLFLGETPYTYSMCPYHAANTFAHRVATHVHGPYHLQIHQRCHRCGRWFLPRYLGAPHYGCS